jgi:hypothetical protein
LFAILSTALPTAGRGSSQATELAARGQRSRKLNETAARPGFI